MDAQEPFPEISTAEQVRFEILRGFQQIPRYLRRDMLVEDKESYLLAPPQDLFARQRQAGHTENILGDEPKSAVRVVQCSVPAVAAERCVFPKVVQSALASFRNATGSPSVG